VAKVKLVLGYQPWLGFQWTVKRTSLDSITRFPPQMLSLERIFQTSIKPEKEIKISLKLCSYFFINLYMNELSLFYILLSVSKNQREE
jgi:hypothetical protein